ncbi:MAG: DapH/DapD/GlmU-related protein [Solirubrobacteraceae bacterium]
MKGFLSIPRFLLYLPLALASRLGGAATQRDILRVLQPRLDLPLADSYTWRELTSVLAHRPFRSVLYARLVEKGVLAHRVGDLLSIFYKGEPAMFISCVDIGPGLMFMHGFATIVVAQKIGTDCQISQQVTIGYDDRGAPPILGDRVRVGANAVIIGPVSVGDDAVVGAGAVVVRDVPPAAVVGGVPAKVLEGAADRFSAKKRR